MDFSPGSLYWVYSPEGPTKEQSACGMMITGGVVPGPVSGRIAERLCALGYRAREYHSGEEILGWCQDAMGEPGWSVLIGTPSLRCLGHSDRASILASLAFSEIDPTALDWPDQLSPEWVAAIRQYDKRSGLRYK